MATNARSKTPTTGDERYRYLERRPNSWRRELFLKGRNKTAGQLVHDMRANGITPEQAVENYGLPLEQILEALRYYEAHRDLIEADVDEERRHAAAMGIDVDAPALAAT